MKVINLLAGPGTGKSTTASGLYFEMKKKFYRVELVREYIKNPVYEKRQIFDDQIYIFAKQHRLQHILKNDCEWIVTDSPLLLSAVYAPINYFPSFQGLVLEAFETYENFNFFLTREKKYVNLGRTQTKEEAEEIDYKVKHFLNHNKLPYHTVNGNNAVNEIMEILNL